MPYTRKQHKLNLKESIERAKATKLKLNVIIIGHSCCSECDKIDKKILPFKEVIENSLLPYNNCIRKNGCICCYGFIPLGDENDNPID